MFRGFRSTSALPMTARRVGAISVRRTTTRSERPDTSRSYSVSPVSLSNTDTAITGRLASVARPTVNQPTPTARINSDAAAASQAVQREPPGDTVSIAPVRLRRRGERLARPDRRNKTVALPRQRLDEARVVAFVTERQADLRQAVSEPASEIHVRVSAPDGTLQLVARDHLACAREQQCQRTRGLRLDCDEPSVLPQLQRPIVEFEDAELVRHRWVQSSSTPARTAR